MDETTTVVECDLGWIVGWNKPAFLGHEVLRKQKADGPSRIIVGFEMLAERAIARQGYPVRHAGVEVGRVTSGTQTPFLKKAIGMAYVPVALAAAGTELDIDVRGRAATARVVPLPFYKRPKQA
jgi:aminomethyltransferase